MKRLQRILIPLTLALFLLALLGGAGGFLMSALRDELGLAWDDPAVVAAWGIDDPILSGRDHGNPLRAAIEPRHRPAWPMRT